MRSHYRFLNYHLNCCPKILKLQKTLSFSTSSSSSLFHSLDPLLLPSPKFQPHSRLHLANLLQLSTAQFHPLPLFKQIHAQIIVSNLVSYTFIGNVLVKSYGKAGFLGSARKVFDRMLERNLISWTSMLSVYTQHGFFLEALWVFLNFKRCCSESPEWMIAGIIRACTRLGSCVIGEQVHSHVVKEGFDQDVYVGTSLVDFYAKIADIDDARIVFDGLLVKSTVTWTAMITGYVKCGRSEASLLLFNKMRETNVVPDKYVLSSVLSACSGLVFVKGGKQVHGYLLRKGIKMDVSISNVLIDFYMKCGKVETAENIFYCMVDRDVISWTTVIAGCMQNSFDWEAMRLFSEMQKLGWSPDGFACTSILTSCGTLNSLEKGRQVHAYSIKGNLLCDIFMQNSLIDMYAKCNSLIDARRVFDSLDDPNVVSYNAIIEGYSRIQELYEAVNFFHEMRLQMLMPSLLTFVSLLGVSAALLTSALSKQIHALVIKFGFSFEAFASSALIDVYSKCSYIEDARLLFDETIDKDIVVWNTMLFGYTHQFENEEALKLYSELQLSEQKPNDFTFAALLTAASNLASLQNGQQLHNHLIKMGLDLYAITTNSLIDMYAKCGSSKDACKAFDSALWRDVVCWNSIISTYAHHGEAQKALQMFDRMLKEGIKPNDVSFVGVLSACSHAGFVEEGLHQFVSMPRFGIEPGIEHYSCLVSLLGRAGKLYEAKELIETMPTEPPSTVWRCLLSACRISGNVELGKYAAEKAISIDSMDSGSYALLSNIYASKEMWQDVKQAREKFDSNRVIKETGCSWVEVNNKVHVFIARDRTHFKTEQIFSVLDDLFLQIRGTANVPDIPMLSLTN